MDFLCKVADYYGVTTDYILGRTDSRKGLDSTVLEDKEEDTIFDTQTIYRAAIMTHERMNAGSSQAGEFADLLYAVTIYRTLFSAAQNGYIPKRWFSLPPKYVHSVSLALSEGMYRDFPEKTVTARRYGGPEPKSIETVIKNIEGVKEQIPQLVDKCLAYFPGVDRTNSSWEGLAAAQQCLPNDEIRDKFGADFRVLNRIWNIVSPDPCLQDRGRMYR